MRTITKKEWVETHKDFRSVINGQRYVMMYDNGTCLVPVKVEGLKDLPTRAQGIRNIAASGKAGIVDEKRISVGAARLIVKHMDKHGEGTITQQGFDWHGFCRDVEAIAKKQPLPPAEYPVQTLGVAHDV